MLQNRRFGETINRFKKNTRIVPKSYKEINLKYGFKSIKLDSLYFTNYTKSMGCSIHKDLRKIYSDFINGEDILNKYFVAEELLPHFNFIRLATIVKNLHNKRSIDAKKFINTFKKFKNIESKNIQFYFEYENENLTLYLVDIYHLAIVDTGYYKTEEQVYESNKSYKMDICIIADQLIRNKEKYISCSI